MRYTILFLFIAFQGIGQTKWPMPVEINADTFLFQLPEKNLYFLNDDQNRHSLVEIQKSPDFVSKFEGKTKNTWFKTIIKNNTNRASDVFLSVKTQYGLSNSYAILLDVYWSYDQQNWTHLKTGTLRAKSERDDYFGYKDYFRLKVPTLPQQQTYIIAKVKVPFWYAPISSVKPYIESKSKVFEELFESEVVWGSDKKSLIHGVFTGILLTATFLLLIMFFSIKRREYLYFFFSMLFLTLATYHQAFGYTVFNNHILTFSFLYEFFYSLFLVFLVLFVITFIRDGNPILKRFILSLTGVTVLVNLVYTFWGNHYNLFLTFRFGVEAVYFLLVLYSYLKWKRGSSQAGFSLVSLLPLFIVWLYFLSFLLFWPSYNFPFQVYTYVETLCIFWLVIGFFVALLSQFEKTRKRLIISKLDKERLEKEKEIEKNEILANQKVLLEKQVASRTQELNNTIDSLKSTQDQLIQKEKLASLGELTAGIAHEIQNPLNFVNNFSELSIELIDELKELETEKSSDETLKTELLDDLAENQKKINHHGKRASNIVKGMLAHSRASTGERVLTNINELADEYLRLSFHGMRAKDKSFNSDFKIEIDPKIPEINIVPQDIGRVLLNLINNAFYAVHEKSKQGISGYKPLVEVTTEWENDNVVIIIKDNGSGISDSIKNKIFQPFFTTKPTGEGTGLGLSLSYDIITKGHGGELKIESVEGVGSTFIITLPT